jgi:hypothetical protein
MQLSTAYAPRSQKRHRQPARLLLGVFRPAGLELAVGAQQRTGVVPFEPPVIVPPNSDFRLVASASTTDLVVTGVINGVKFKEQGV